MTAAAFLARNQDPDAAEIEEAMSGNLCRCGTYPRIREAVASAAREVQ
jgi:isoquinoline 1-oxidoreductase alpha subunit